MSKSPSNRPSHFTANPLQRPLEYQSDPTHLQRSAPTLHSESDLKKEEMLVNLGPQHPSTHGVLRLEVITDGETVVKVVPHIGYLHRCFEKHAESLNYAQIIPYVDRMDYLAAMNNEHIYALAVEKMLGLSEKIAPRVEWIRILVAELNRIASHFLAIGTYAMDIGAVTPFLWLMRDREHILRFFEWVSGVRLLYNYIWVGGLYYDLPVGFEEKCLEFVQYLKPKLVELSQILLENKIFVERTALVGVLPLQTALNCGATGVMLRASGLRYDLRKAKPYSFYSQIDFDVPIGEGIKGKTGDCWDRTYVRALECQESLKIIAQCLEILTQKEKRTRDFDPQAAVPRRIKPTMGDFYFSGETPRGELGFFIRSDGKSDRPLRMKVRAPSFSNLSALPLLAEGVLLADLIAIIGSVDIVLGEVDR
ncbi:NADH-quinone oxidoreductase subunit D [Hugenholtzia roseola]|uniref:NADH-quinone oxidoreductase subunit D n=1 Tax=Hugenholtzia roseola TaxID=1002 RepID=UPI0004270271|nr:NADH-quinone oxidoreductase subunit D [Hugenholtzia roseola]